MFPLGDTRKADVRREADARGLAVAAKPDSHDICFIADGDTAGFLQRPLGSEPGPVVDTDGVQVGEHDGALRLHRRPAQGLRIGRPAPDGLPRYVLDVSPVTRTVTVGTAEELDVGRPGRRPAGLDRPAPRRTDGMSRAGPRARRAGRRDRVVRGGRLVVELGRAAARRRARPGRRALRRRRGARLCHHRRHHGGTRNHLTGAEERCGSAPTCPWPTSAAGCPTAGDLVAYAAAARELGFATLSANDHLFWKRPWLDGPTALASVAAAAGDLTLATSLALPVVRHPVVVAKMLTSLAALAQGPVVGGLGPGSSRVDLEAVGVRTTSAGQGSTRPSGWSARWSTASPPDPPGSTRSKGGSTRHRSRRRRSGSAAGARTSGWRRWRPSRTAGSLGVQRHAEQYPRPGPGGGTGPAAEPGVRSSDRRLCDDSRRGARARRRPGRVHELFDRAAARHCAVRSRLPAVGAQELRSGRFATACPLAYAAWLGRKAGWLRY